jgi:hypothetical protein
MVEGAHSPDVGGFACLRRGQFRGERKANKQKKKPTVLFSPMSNPGHPQTANFMFWCCCFGPLKSATAHAAED